jgi:hypothetical protein
MLLAAARTALIKPLRVGGGIAADVRRHRRPEEDPRIEAADAARRQCRRAAAADRRPVNVIVSDAAAEAGVGAFGFTEFAHVGLPLVAGTVLFVLTAVFGQLISNSVFGVIRPGGCSHRRWAADSA